MPVEVATMTDLQTLSADFTQQIAALNAKIDAAAMPQDVKDAMKIILAYFLTKVTT